MPAANRFGKKTSECPDPICNSKKTYGKHFLTDSREKIHLAIYKNCSPRSGAVIGGVSTNTSRESKSAPVGVVTQVLRILRSASQLPARKSMPWTEVGAMQLQGVWRRMRISFFFFRHEGEYH
jgi:hypothetical protein